MKNALLIALALAAGIAPVAQAADRHDDRNGPRWGDRGDHGRAEHRGRHDNDRGRHDNRGRHDGSGRHDGRGRHDRYVAPAYYAPAPAWQGHRYSHRPSWQYRAPAVRYDVVRYVPPRGYRARHWRNGDYLPVAYRGPSYVLDYRHYRLPPPPYGYHYVRVDGNAVLAAIATGLIADVVFDLFRH
jgi:Ni/Co efflux regulator RcnB